MAETDHPLKQLVAAFKQDFASLRSSILDTAMVRFSPNEQECSQIEAGLSALTDEARLCPLFRTALRAKNLS